jgi:GH15 family glucan-1,4-alpha-glucosidase
MAWLGLDRLVKMSEKYKWREQVEGFRNTAQSIRHEIESRGYNQQLGAYTMDLDGKTLDASTLVFSLVDYCEASSPRMVSTVKAVCDQLSRHNLIYRYHSGD